MPSIRSAAFYSVLPLSIVLAACGSDETGEEGAATPSPVAVQSEDSSFVAPTLDDGVTYCFDKISEKLGANAKVAEASVSYSPGKDIQNVSMKPKGQMTTCSVQYQSPDDPRKLLSISMDMKTGNFDEPRPMEIQVMGDAADFNLEDHLIPLANVNFAGLPELMKAQEPELAKTYSSYAWTGVTLDTPVIYRTPKPVHTLDVRLSGRLASNDVTDSGTMKVATDGTTIESNSLLP